MRKDMAKVIVERPRKGGNFGRKGRARPLDELPSQQGIRRPHRELGPTKILNENLAPLKRYLARQVGRPWDKVFAEIAAGLRVDSTVQKHVRDHVPDFVAIEPRRAIRIFRLRDGTKERIGTLWRQPFYVDPADGLLKRTDLLPEEKARRRRVRERRPPAPTRIALAPDRELRAIDGVWYELRMAPLPEPRYRAVREQQHRALKPWSAGSRTVEIETTVRRLVTRPVLDVATGMSMPAGPEHDDDASWRAFRYACPDRRYAVAKRQLSARELRQHGLTNQQVD